MEYIPFMELLFLAEDIHGRTKIIIKNNLDMGELFQINKVYKIIHIGLENNASNSTFINNAYKRQQNS